MESNVVSHRVTHLIGNAALARFMAASTWARRQNEPGIADFTLGNPNDMPLPAFTEALQRWSVPRNARWFAYKNSEPDAQAVIAASLHERRGVAFEPADIALTNGAFAGLAVSFLTVTDPGDEVIFLSPPWFFYEPLIIAANCTPVRVTLPPPGFDLDPNAIAAAITPRTRAIIVNSPHNPSGRIYPPEALTELARVLTDASARHGRPIYLLSDEAYCRIVYDGRSFPSPTAFYPYSILIYTYGKTLLTPGERLGYLALPPEMPLAAREQLRGATMLAQFITGHAFPNALLQHALGDLDKLSIDVGHLQRRRDRMVTALRGAGYEVNLPEGTFYLLVRSPLGDDFAFTELLAQRDVFVLPGSTAECPGYFRISLTASDEMIDRALPVFAAAIQEAAAAPVSS
jgi:aspartate aminotransferase